MITENIVLDSDLKRELKHLSIDIDEYVSVMLVNGAKYILDNDITVKKIIANAYEPFTMKIDEGLKQKIKVFCRDEDIRIKDFWNEAGFIAIEKGGVF